MTIWLMIADYWLIDDYVYWLIDYNDFLIDDDWLKMMIADDILIMIDYYIDWLMIVDWWLLIDDD